MLNTVVRIIGRRAISEVLINERTIIFDVLQTIHDMYLYVSLKLIQSIFHHTIQNSNLRVPVPGKLIPSI